MTDGCDSKPGSDRKLVCVCVCVCVGGVIAYWACTSMREDCQDSGRDSRPATRI